MASLAPLACTKMRQYRKLVVLALVAIALLMLNISIMVVHPLSRRPRTTDPKSRTFRIAVWDNKEGHDGWSLL